MAVLTHHIMILWTQAFHWLAKASQSAAHSQLNDKASPWQPDFFTVSWNPADGIKSKLIVVIPVTIQIMRIQWMKKERHSGELFFFLSWSDGWFKQNQSRNVYIKKKLSCLLERFACLPACPHLNNRKVICTKHPWFSTVHIHLNDK